jgi:predicted MFS family arabinose efflux permease
MLGSLAYAIIQGPSDGWISPPIIGFFLLSVAALAGLLVYEPRRQEPLIDFRFFRSVPFSASTAVAVCAIATSAGFLFLTTLYLQDVRGFSALRAGLTLLPMPIMMAVTAPVAGRMLSRGGPRVPFIIAGAALTLSTAALSQLSYNSGTLFFVITYGLFGIGAGIVNPPISNGIMSGVPKSQAGVASGMNSSARQLGQSLGVAIVGSVLAASLHGGMDTGFLKAAHASWWIMAACGYAVLVLGVISTTGWARATIAKAGGNA